MDHPLLASPESPHHQLEKTPAPTTSQSNIGSQVSNNSESGHSATTRKRNRDETDNSAAANDTNPASMTRDDTSPEQQNQQQQQQRRSRRFSSEDLLAPSAKFNKQAFQEACIGDIEETSAEQQALLEEYAQWEWLHRLWNQSRSVSDDARLRQEIATISRWTELKEQELEEARVEHKHNLEKISQVLGINMM